MTRYIDADMCIAKIKDMPVTYDAETVQRCIEVVSNAPTIDVVPQWIPVSERLPKESGIYLVTLKTDGVAYFEDEFPNGFVYASAYETVTMNWEYGSKNVIAWMPLPKPYEVEQ